jgi:hypothetical protein
VAQLEPPDVYLTIDPTVGGVAGADAPDDEGPTVPVREAVAESIRAAMPAKTKTEVAKKVGRTLNDWAFKGAWEDLARKGQIVQINGGWVSSSGAPTLGPATTTTPEGSVA